jgi:hypothetical protein
MKQKLASRKLEAAYEKQNHTRKNEMGIRTPVLRVKLFL